MTCKKCGSYKHETLLCEAGVTGWIDRGTRPARRALWTVVVCTLALEALLGMAGFAQASFAGGLYLEGVVAVMLLIGIMCVAAMRQTWREYRNEKRRIGVRTTYC